MPRSPAMVLSVLLLSGCASNPPTLIVDLKTDLLPGYEFAEVETTLLDPGSDVGLSTSRMVDHTVNYLLGARVAEFDDVGTTQHRIRVRLRAEEGELVAQRDTVVTATSGQFAVTVLITRDCRGVTCPTPGGSGDATECFAGRCVRSDCSPENPAACGSGFCTSDADCTRTSDCASFRCDQGACLAAPVPGACTDTEYCSVERGCLPLDGDCVPGSVCATGNPCEAGQVDCSTGRAICRGSGPSPEGTPCRPAADGCDAPENCDGASTACPADELAPVGTPCADGFCNGLGTCAPCTAGAACSTGNPCELGETECSTGSPVCVVAGAAPAGTPCRGMAGECDVAETCDGAATECPPDTFASGTSCRAAMTACDAAESCDGSSPTCPADGVAASGSVCRPSAVPCDAPEVCDGSTLACPLDAMIPATCGQEWRLAGTFMWAVPVSCTSLRVRAWGAGGGHGRGNTRAAAGGYVEATVAVTPEETLTVAVGGAGVSSPGGGGGAGGLHGGGTGGYGNSSQGGGGGGGFSGVFRGAIAQANALIMAGGGAGSGGGASALPGAGGGTAGQNGTGLGGTQTAGGGLGSTFGGPTPGAALRGGNGGVQTSGDGGGGGGGGYFGGGGGGAANSDATGGGGGSGFVHVDAAAPTLTTGNRDTAGNAAAPARMGAGNPVTDGAIIVECL